MRQFLLFTKFHAMFELRLSMTNDHLERENSCILSLDFKRFSLHLIRHLLSGSLFIIFYKENELIKHWPPSQILRLQ